MIRGVSACLSEAGEAAVWELLISSLPHLQSEVKEKPTHGIHKSSEIRVQEEGWVHKSQPPCCGVLRYMV